MSTIDMIKAGPDPEFLEQPLLASRFLEQALLLAIVCHAAAMLSMAILLLPGMPGGSNVLTDRVAYIAANPWLWRLGWLPLPLTAPCDPLIFVSLPATK